MRGFYFLISFILSVIASFLVSAYSKADDTTKSVYIVYMGATHWPNGAKRTDHAELLQRLKKRNNARVLRTYNKSFLGFAALLSKQEAKSMEECRGVVSVFPDSSLELHTTRSWEFLRSQDAFRIINKKATTTTTTTTISPPYASNFLSGDHDTIIGMIDTGIWPEASSFMPTQRMRQTPTRWKGKCLGGKNFSCNWKVIGARFYDDPLHPGRVTSARDMYGHGMLTSSIAAGMPVSGASYYGLAKGTAIGGSPNSRIAMYCIAGADYTTLSAILKSIDDAIHDGVDVISIPYRYPENVDFLANPVYIAAFHAAARGVTVVGSAGNQGPDPESVTNNAPWILSVGATTIDRDLEADILFDEKTSIKGGGINFCRLSKSYPLIDAVRAATNPRDPYNASHCFPGSLDPKKVKGKLLLCENDDNNYETTEKFESLKKLGVIGMIAISGYERQEQLFYGTNPIAAVTERDGSWIRTYINSKRKTLAKILPTTTILNYTPAPVVAEFSSRGPPPGIQNLIKPDVVAPGVGILAAYPPFDYYKISGMDPPDFIILWGTSLSCAHAVGLAALIKSQHPTWSSSAIISAIMTTATYRNNLQSPITTVDGSIATPYHMGSGEISLTASLQPGLVYETETTDYIQFLCNMGYSTSTIKLMASSYIPHNFSCPCDSHPDFISDMNYPSIAISGLEADKTKTVKRSVTNVGERYSTYEVFVEAPAGLEVQVVPSKLQFTEHVNKLSFQVRFKLTTTSDHEKHSFGSITWVNLKHEVRSPFVVSWA